MSAAHGTEPFEAAVLCGGASRRMGTDKALLEIDGVPMVARVRDALLLAGARAPVVALGGDAAALGALDLVVVPDEEPGAGPLAAIAAALRRSDLPVVLVVACDLVAPHPAALLRTVDALAQGSGAHVAVPVVDGRPQWAHAAWSVDAGPLLDAALAAGEHAIWRGAARLRVIEVDGIDPAALRDADDPGDLPPAAASDRRSARAGSLRTMDIPEIDVASLAELRAAGATLIDVREEDEFTTARVPGAQHIPLGSVVERIDEVPTEGTVYVICARGGRSAKAVEHYRSQGIDAVNVAGGTLGWIDAGLPTDSDLEGGAGRA